MASFSDDEEETLVTIGTPLEIPDKDEPVKKPIKIQDTQAKDDKGRARFHGAFTGGFSAGYFNSVGSEKGWAPSTFISSRNDRRTEQSGQKPEDFMDDEDMGEYGIAPRKFVTDSKFSSEERKKRQFSEAQMATADTVLPGASALLEIIVPERLTIGVRLLRKMGWKEGQGIGPRLSKKQKKESQKKVFGCMPPPDADDDVDYDSIFPDVTFAPRDSRSVSMSTKVNTHGLGYRGLDPSKALPSTHISLFEPPRVTKTGSKRGIRGQGFGVGALEEDDDDIYQTDNMSNYDMTMGVEEDDQFGWTRPSGKRASETPVNYVGRMLDGFTLSSKKLVQKKDFPPPRLPSDYRPVHRFYKQTSSLSTQSSDGVDYRLLLDQSVDTVRTVTQIPSTSPHGTSQHPTSQQGTSTSKTQVYNDAASRSLALEEKPFVGSVFDLISKEGKDKLERVKQGTNLVDETVPTGSSAALTDPAGSENNSNTVAKSSHQPEAIEQTSELPSGAFGGLGFKPFQKDEGKQARYEKYLELVKTGNKDPFSSIFTSGQTEWEMEKEKEEFSRAAKLYRPLSGMMAMRFTRGGHQDDGNQAVPHTEQKAEDVKDEQKAADMKMYGKLTREVIEWRPDNIVCKRFNVPNPYPGSTFTGSRGSKRDKYSVFNFLNFAEPTQSDIQQQSSYQTETPKQSSTSDDVKTEESKSSENKADVALNRGKSMKSIFSHLVNTESAAQKSTKPVSFSVKSSKASQPAKEFKSIFSHLENTENSAKVTSDKMVPMETDNSENVSADVSKETNKNDANKKPEPVGMDLFRAIFKNSDSEDSSSSSEESEKETIVPKTSQSADLNLPQTSQSADLNLPQTSQSADLNLPQTSQGADLNPRVNKPTSEIEEKTVSSQPMDEETASEDVMYTATRIEDVVDTLPGNNVPIESLTSRLSHNVPIESLTSRLSPVVLSDDDDDSYGPALPPSTITGNVSADASIPTSEEFINLTKHSSSKHKHKAKHKSKKDKKDKKDKHKKSKHKKKSKSKDKKHKKSSRHDNSHHSDSSDTTDKDDSEDDMDTAILSRLKSIQSSQRKRMMDL